MAGWSALGGTGRDEIAAPGGSRIAPGQRPASGRNFRAKAGSDSSDMRVMASPYPSSRQRFETSFTVSRLGRDITWGRFLFLPPQLANPRLIFDPLPFRAQEFALARPRRSASSR